VLTNDSITVRANLELLVRERGKLKERRLFHNIVPNVGLTWLSKLICGELPDYISKIGPGIGGYKQNNPLADEAPLTVYPVVGAHSQTDTDMTVFALERPVAISSTSYPIAPGDDIWLKSTASVDHPAINKTRLIFIFTEDELSFADFNVVPLSELGLFTSEKDETLRTNQLVAYKAFAPIPKTSVMEIEIRWTITIG
jgi:hypothetical protein